MMAYKFFKRSASVFVRIVKITMNKEFPKRGVGPGGEAGSGFQED